MNTLSLLRSLPYFRSIPAEDLAPFASDQQILRVPCGQALLTQNEAGEDAFLVLDGRLRTTALDSRDQSATIGEIGRGEIVGETAALLGRPRQATVTAVRDSLLLRIPASDLLALLQTHPEALRAFARTLIERAETTFAYRQPIDSVLLFPLTPDLDPEALGRDLQTALQRFQTTEWATPDTTTAHWGQPLTDRDPAEIGAYLASQESTEQLHLYASPGTWDTWTQACVRRVDRILLIASADQFRPPSEAYQQLQAELEQSNHIKVELVLLHPTRTHLPTGTARWLGSYPVHRHHHIVRGEAAGQAKIARFLTGNAVGMALSGGGFKSSLQGGILHAMREGGIPVDIFGGSSGGAMTGATFAHEPRPEEIRGITEEAMGSFRKIMQLTAPVVSLFSGRRFTRGFQQFFGDTQIEDLWTNYFCLSLSLVSGQLMVHREGPLWEAIRASSAVMGLFPPVMKDGDCLVDGGFINPCPTDILHQMGAGKIIVVSAFGKAGIQTDAHFPPETSGWPLLWRRINPFYKQKIRPSLGTNIIQSMLMASDHLLRDVYAKSQIDLFIEPDLSQYSAQDGDAVEKMYEEGYAFGQAHIAEWKETILG